MPTYTPKNESKPSTKRVDAAETFWRIEGELPQKYTSDDVKFSAKGNPFLPFSIHSGNFYYRTVTFDPSTIDYIITAAPHMMDFEGTISTRKNPTTGYWEIQLVCNNVS